MWRDYAGTATQRERPRERDTREGERERAGEKERASGQGNHLAMQMALFSQEIMSFTMAETMANMVKELEHVFCSSTSPRIQH